MRKESLSKTFAKNLAAAMRDYGGGLGISQARLSELSGVGQTTISLYLNPDRRAPVHGKSDPSPTLERVSMLAAALKVSPWELLHPNVNQVRRDHKLVEQIERTLKQTAPEVPS